MAVKLSFLSETGEWYIPGAVSLVYVPRIFRLDRTCEGRTFEIYQCQLILSNETECYCLTGPVGGNEHQSPTDYPVSKILQQYILNNFQNIMQFWERLWMITMIDSIHVCINVNKCELNYNLFTYDIIPCLWASRARTPADPGHLHER